MTITTTGGLPNNAYGANIGSIVSPVTGGIAVQLSAPGAPGINAVETESQKATYAYATASFTLAATPTDILTLAGSASVVTRIKRISVFGISTAPGTLPISIVRRSTANSGGTSTSPTIMKHDISSATASTVVQLYTANTTTLGTTTGIIHNGRIVTASTVGVTTSGQALVWDFTVRNDEALVLRGAADIIAINGNGATVPGGGSFDLDVEFTEEPIGV